MSSFQQAGAILVLLDGLHDRSLPSLAGLLASTANSLLCREPHDARLDRSRLDINRLRFAAPNGFQ